MQILFRPVIVWILQIAMQIVDHHFLGMDDAPLD